MKKLLKSKKALSPVVAAIILIAVTVAVSIAVAAWMGSLTIGFMNTKEVKITAMEFTDDGGTPADQYITLDVINPGTSKVNIATIKINDDTVDEGDVYEGDDLTAAISGLPIQVEADSGTVQYSIDVTSWTAGQKYSVSFFETDGTLVGSFTDTA
jgi:flagellin-like protein